MRTHKIIFLFFLLLYAGTAWSQIGELISPGDLSKPHSKFSGVKSCNVCHAGNKSVLEGKCLDCHKELQARIVARKGFHAGKSTGCVKCHSDHLGKDFDIRGLDLKTFRHEETGYALTGKHQQIDCSSCHKQRSFLGLSAACQTCHKDPHLGRLPSCESCHATDRSFRQVSIDHSKMKMPLTGAHQKVACMQCHKNQVFQGLSSSDCTSCHKDPHRATLGNNCSSCHNTEAWKATKVEHRTFPLLGKHAAVSCAKCHPDGKWKLKSFARCADCHQDPHLGQFKQSCEQCHTVEGFKPAKFQHDVFPLVEKHALACAKCHKLERGDFPQKSGQTVRYKPLSKECAACHKDFHAGQLSRKCEMCHTIQSFQVAGFDHSKTRFPLDRDHVQVACAKCHKVDVAKNTIQYKPLATGCFNCHGDVHLGQLSKNCEQCHTTAGVKFNHALSLFPLTGKHTQVTCEKCHRKEKGKFPAGSGETVRYKPLAQNCSSCHADYHRAQFKQDCVSCHTTASFRDTTFSHAKTAFALTGAHAKARCDQCHKTEIFESPPPAVQLVRYKLTGASCSSCHQDAHHGKFGANCARCHNTTEWKSVNRAFHKKGLFPLDGRHLSVECESCHLKGVIQGTPTRCYDCHWIRRQDDLFRTRLGTDCERCHVTTSWTALIWNHESETGLALGAAHRALGCESCHKNQDFRIASSDCYSCHQQDFLTTAQPSHTRAGFPTVCDVCHRPSDPTWHQSSFNHTAIYPLIGRHATAACQSCHANGIYKGTLRDCYACHKTDYDRTREPNHLQAGFPTSCESCHRPSDSAWFGRSFNHNDVFRLVGIHATVSCTACHKNNIYSGTPHDCYGCHKADYDRATPNHVQSGFPTSCEACHNPAAAQWEAAFDHNKIYPLVGAHKTAACEACHVNNVYQGTPTNCYSCHKTDYQQTKNPNHTAAGFPTSCEVCHKASDASWNAASFNHDQVFSLVGLHKTAPCSACHINNIYSGTPRDCYGCHQTQYQQTKDPNHISAGFPTSCESCHRATDTSWNQGTFNHTWFPINSGKHANISCASCHPNSGNYNIFSCTNCHSRSDTDPHHTDVGGYVYSSQACYSCHPRGTAED